MKKILTWLAIGIPTVILTIGVGLWITHRKPSEDTIWKTYSDPRYGFSMQYPCDDTCIESPYFSQIKGRSITENVIFPTENKRTFIHVAMIEEPASISYDEPGPGLPFPYSFSKMRSALELPVNQKCAIFNYNSESTNAPDEFCSITLLSGYKAIQVLVAKEYPGETGSKIRYFIPYGERLWLEINEYFEHDNDQTFIVNPTTGDPQLQQKMIAAKKVLKTLKFGK